MVALVEELAGIGRHRFLPREAAVRTGDHGLEHGGRHADSRSQRSSLHRRWAGNHRSQTDTATIRASAAYVSFALHPYLNHGYHDSSNKAGPSMPIRLRCHCRCATPPVAAIPP